MQKRNTVECEAHVSYNGREIIIIMKVRLASSFASTYWSRYASQEMDDLDELCCPEKSFITFSLLNVWVSEPRVHNNVLEYILCLKLDFQASFRN